MKKLFIALKKFHISNNTNYWLLIGFLALINGKKVPRFFTYLINYEKIPIYTPKKDTLDPDPPKNADPDPVGPEKADPYGSGSSPLLTTMNYISSTKCFLRKTEKKTQLIYKKRIICNPVSCSWYCIMVGSLFKWRKCFNIVL